MRSVSAMYACRLNRMLRRLVECRRAPHLVLESLPPRPCSLSPITRVGLILLLHTMFRQLHGSCYHFLCDVLLFCPRTNTILLYKCTVNPKSSADSRTLNLNYACLFCITTSLDIRPTRKRTVSLRVPHRQHVALNAIEQAQTMPSKLPQALHPTV